jgi:glutamate-5-semialdehyde dehydrogenase
MPGADLHSIGVQARAASKHLARASTDQKNATLHAIADGLLACQDEILRANAVDVDHARARGVEAHFVDRLTLDPQRLDGLAGDVRNVAALPDPIGERFDDYSLPNGLRLHKRRVPLGVLGVIYESRPNVTTDIAALALKSGNAAILRGGSDNINSNRALLSVIDAALRANGLPAAAVQLIDDPDRARILDLLRLNDYVDLIIPRGGAALHTLCRDNSTIPVITGGMGINHLYVDETADQASAVDIVFNSKTQKPSACNSLGTLLVDSRIAAEFLPRVAARLADKHVELRCDSASYAVLDKGTKRHGDKVTEIGGVALPPGRHITLSPAQPGDWDSEWLAPILGVAVVDSLDEALAFVKAHSLEHSDGLCSRDPEHIARFLNEIDSSAVFVNASMRFNDGGQFGLGAEVAISTQRIHARGPMGLRELTSYKWVCEGDGQVRP